MENNFVICKWKRNGGTGFRVQFIYLEIKVNINKIIYQDHYIRDQYCPIIFSFNIVKPLPVNKYVPFHKRQNQFI